MLKTLVILMVLGLVVAESENYNFQTLIHIDRS